MIDPIDPTFRKQMNDLARGLDQIFNGTKQGKSREVAFVLLVTPFEDAKKVSYISNAERNDVIAMMKEFIARNEGQPLTPGRA